jgi:site-specific DNA recombinase
VHQYLLRALLSCGRCQLSCFCRTSDSHGYYVCRGKQPAVYSRRETPCPSRYLRAEQLDALVWQDLCELLQQPRLLEQALQRAQAGEWLPQELGARRERLRQARAGVDAQLERLTEAYLAGVIPLDEYEHRRKEVEQRQQALDSQARQMEASVQQQLELASLTGSIKEFCARVSRGLEQVGFEQQRQLVELLIDRVVVTGEDVEIRYVIPTAPGSEHTRFCHLLSDYSAAK